MYDRDSGEVRAITRVPAGYGKVVVLEELGHGLRLFPAASSYNRIWWMS